MSSYIDHREVRSVLYDIGDDKKASVLEAVTIHSWSTFTADRSEWLYGPGRSETPQARADLDSWNRLGLKVAA